MLEITNENIDDVIASSDLLFIDIWKEWCGPCKRSTPVFEEIANQVGNDSRVFAKLDAQNNTDAGNKLKVMSLPTFVIFEKGKLIKKWTGADIGRLRKEIDSVIKK